MELLNVTVMVLPSSSSPPPPSLSLPSSASNSDDLQRQLYAVRLVVQKVLVPAIVAFGLTGNVVNVAVLTGTLDDPRPDRTGHGTSPGDNTTT